MAVVDISLAKRWHDICRASIVVELLSIDMDAMFLPYTK